MTVARCPCIVRVRIRWWARRAGADLAAGWRRRGGHRPGARRHLPLLPGRRPRPARGTARPGRAGGPAERLRLPDPLPVPGAARAGPTAPARARGRGRRQRPERTARAWLLLGAPLAPG